MLPEIRWMQRLDSFERAFAVLQRIAAIRDERKLSEAEELGLIQSFEFSFECAWQLMKDFLTYTGISGILGSRDAIRHAFNKGIISNGETWIEMLGSRNETVHSYDNETSSKISGNILNLYKNEMEDLLKTMKKQAEERNAVRAS